MTRSSPVQILPPPPTISSDLEIDGKPGCEARLPPFSASVVASVGCWVEHPGVHRVSPHVPWHSRRRHDVRIDLAS